KSRRKSHRSQRSSASGHTQLWLGIVEVLGASRGRSPLIIEDLDVYLQLPRDTGAPTLNSEEPEKPHRSRTTGRSTPAMRRPPSPGAVKSRFESADRSSGGTYACAEVSVSKENCSWGASEVVDASSEAKSALCPAIVVGLSNSAITLPTSSGTSIAC